MLFTAAVVKALEPFCALLSWVQRRLPGVRAYPCRSVSEDDVKMTVSGRRWRL
jgi:hypothetical protein